MPEPVDPVARIMGVHAEPVASEAWAFFLDFFAAVERMNKHAVVEGGWATAAHGSPVPSVDLDVLVDEAEFDEDRDFYDLLHGEGAFERDDGPSILDWNFKDFNRAWASSRGYERAVLLEGRTERVLLQAPSGEKRLVTVPTVPALLVMKLKAFRDRNLQFLVMRDPAEVASYDPNDIAVVHPSEDYRLRKAAKDLVDVGYLWRKASTAQRAEAQALLRQFDLLDLVRTALRSADPQVVSAADYLMRLHRLPGSGPETIALLLEDLGS